MSDRSSSLPLERREFARLALGALGAAALAGRDVSAQARPGTPGIKLCVQSPATPTRCSVENK